MRSRSFTAPWIEAIGVPVLTTWLAMGFAVGVASPLCRQARAASHPAAQISPCKIPDLMVVIRFPISTWHSPVMRTTSWPVAAKKDDWWISIPVKKIAKMKTQIHLPIVADVG